MSYYGGRSRDTRFHARTTDLTFNNKNKYDSFCYYSNPSARNRLKDICIVLKSVKEEFIIIKYIIVNMQMLLLVYCKYVVAIDRYILQLYCKYAVVIDRYVQQLYCQYVVVIDRYILQLYCRQAVVIDGYILWSHCNCRDRRTSSYTAIRGSQLFK